MQYIYIYKAHLKFIFVHRTSTLFWMTCYTTATMHWACMDGRSMCTDIPSLAAVHWLLKHGASSLFVFVVCFLFFGLLNLVCISLWQR